MSKYEVFSGPYFPVPGLNTEIYGVNLRIQPSLRKYRTEKTQYLETFQEVITKMYFTILRLKLLGFYNVCEKDIEHYLDYIEHLSTIFKIKLDFLWEVIIHNQIGLTCN